MSWKCGALSLVLLGALSGCWFTGKNGGADAGGGVTTSSGGNGSGGTGGTTGGTTGSTGTTGSAQAACQQQAQALCGLLSQCQELSTTIDCTQSFATECVGNASGSKVPDPDALAACQTATRGAACNLLGIFEALDACSASNLFKPSVGPGGACTQSSDCLPQADGGSMTCLAPKGTCAGTCRAGLSAGDPCGSDAWNHYASCLQGYCNFSQSFPDGGQTPEVCQAYATLGQNCSGGQSCDPATTFCSSPPGQQLCQVRAGSGAACDFSDQCQSGLFCFNPDGGYTDRTCTAKEGPGGGDCGTFYDACDPARAGCDSTGHCVALATQGQSCANGEQCDPTTFCDYSSNYVCNTKHPLGQPCSSDNCQAGSYCHSPDGGFGNSVCTALLSAGGSCQDDTQACAPGTFCDYNHNYVCAPVTAQGQDCSTVSTCDSASYCTYVTFPSTCTALLGPGQPCDFNGCQADYYCHSADGGFGNGNCTATLGAGQPCSASDYGACGRQASCTNGRCEPYSAGPGDPCIVGTTYCSSNGQGTQYCAGVDGGVGVCTAQPQVDAGTFQVPSLGDACQVFSDGGDGCYYVYRCVSGTCRPLPDVGEACAGEGRCRLGLYCEAGTCTASSHLGGPCDPQNSESCLEGHCSTSSRTCVDYKQPGQPCDPHAQDCSNSQTCTYYNDGGTDCTDSSCVAQGSGAPVCVATCY